MEYRFRMSQFPRPQGFDRALFALLETIPGRRPEPKAAQVNVEISAHYDQAGVLKKLEVSSAVKQTIT